MRADWKYVVNVDSTFEHRLITFQKAKDLLVKEERDVIKNRNSFVPDLASIEECKISDKNERLKHKRMKDCNISIQKKCIKDENLDKGLQIVEHLGQNCELDSVQECH